MILPLVLVAPAFAQDLTEGNWIYRELGDGTVEIAGYTGSDSNLNIPASLGGKTVSGIADGAFVATRGIVSITVADGITSIGEEAFADCPDLLSVSLPDSVTSIGRRAFRYCQALESVKLPATLDELPYQGFWDCESLVSVEIPDGVSVIPNGCFYYCISLRSVTVPDSLTALEKNAFHACIRLESIELSAGVVDIDTTAFSDCEWLVIRAPEGSVAETFANTYGFVPENVVIESPHPYSESDFWEYEYEGDAAALRVVFSTKTYVMGPFDMDSITLTDEEGNEYVFVGDELAGKEIVLSGTSFSLELFSVFSEDADFGFRITEIEPLSEAEYEAYLADLDAHPWEAHIVNGTLEITGYRGRMNEVTIPSEINEISVVSIGAGAFRNNRIVTKITVSDGIQTIGEGAFDGCIYLEEVVLPDSVQTLGTCVFISCQSLTDVVLPDSLTSIPDDTFNACLSLESVELPGTVETIGDRAFNNCRGLIEIDLPDGLTGIGESAFSKTALKSIVIPDGVTVLPKGVFENCSDLLYVSLPTELEEIGYGTFSGCTALQVIDLPDSLKTIGNVAFSSTALPSLELPDGLESIGSNAFGGMQLTELTIPKNVHTIGENPVYNCPELTSLTVDPENAYFMSKDNMVFDKTGKILLFCASGLSGKIEIPEGTETIAQSACAAMQNITSAYIPSSITEIVRGAFYGCTALEEVQIKAQISEISDTLFNRCLSLTKVSIPSGVTAIGMMAFADCTALQEIVLPEGVETIGSSAFSNCPALRTVTVPASVNHIDSRAFRSSPNVILLTPADSYAFSWGAGAGILTLDPPKPVSGLRDKGSSYQLVTPGTSSSGQVLYALGTDLQTVPDASAFSEDIPEGAAAGTYPVWYKIVIGDTERGLSLLTAEIQDDSVSPYTGDWTVFAWIAVCCVALIGLTATVGFAYRKKTR